MIVPELLPILVATPFVAAAVALFLGKWTGWRTGLLMVGAALTAFVLTLVLMIGQASGASEEGHAAGAAESAHDAITFVRAWVPDMDLGFALRGDSFGLFFAMVISGIGTLVGIYSLNYIDRSLAPARIGRYYAALTAFMGAMLGIALSDDLILLFVFWEITSITSYILIGFWYEEDFAKKGAWTALQVTGLGGLAMMAGFIMLGVIAGTFSLSGIKADPELITKIQGSPLFVPALLLILAGAFTKSAQWPFHFWLPGAMVAPTPVSTYLHAATMVKAGIFLVGRVWPIFDAAGQWSPLLATFGLITFAYTAYQAFRETDLKAILARTTLSTLGLVMMIYGLKLYEQDALQIFNHAAYKGALFLVVGIVEHAAHTRDLTKLGGMKKRLPVTFWCCVLAALSMAGLPPFFGFLAKESLYEALLHSEVLAQSPFFTWLFISLAVLANAFIFAVAFKLIFGIFLGESRADKHDDHAHADAHGVEHHDEHDDHAHHGEGPGLWFSPAVLAAATLVIGLLGVTGLVQGMVNHFSSDSHAHAHVALIPTDYQPVFLSLVTIGLGIAIYRGREAVNRFQLAVEQFLPTAQSIWDRGMAGVNAFATAYSSRWQSGSLWWYFSSILVFFVGITMYTLSARFGLTVNDIDGLSGESAPWYAVLLCGLLCVAVYAVTSAQTRLAAAIAVTAVGFLVSLMFVVYRSPDILLTQILIETVSTIFILLILYFMPKWKGDRVTPMRKLITWGVSLAVGFTAFSYVLLATTKFKTWDNIGTDYLERSLAEADGRNAVNVIIVDFRAIDTTGEITVLVVVGLCVYGLLRARRKNAIDVIGGRG